MPLPSVVRHRRGGRRPGLPRLAFIDGPTRRRLAIRRRPRRARRRHEQSRLRSKTPTAGRCPSPRISCSSRPGRLRPLPLALARRPGHHPRARRVAAASARANRPPSVVRPLRQRGDAGYLLLGHFKAGPSRALGQGRHPISLAAMVVPQFAVTLPEAPTAGHCVCTAAHRGRPGRRPSLALARLERSPSHRPSPPPAPQPWAPSICRSTGSARGPPRPPPPRAGARPHRHPLAARWHHRGARTGRGPPSSTATTRSIRLASSFRSPVILLVGATWISTLARRRPLRRPCPQRPTGFATLWAAASMPRGRLPRAKDRGCSSPRPLVVRQRPRRGRLALHGRIRRA
jgi:hypothetical protein